MKRLICIPLALLGTACTTLRGDRVEAGNAASGNWRQFYSRDFPEEGRRLDYFYDTTHFRTPRDHVLARWKIIGSTGTVTLYVIDINCRNGTATEKGTLLIDEKGLQRTVPQSELWIDSPIENGSSSDVFRRAFCSNLTPLSSTRGEN